MVNRLRAAKGGLESGVDLDLDLCLGLGFCAGAGAGDTLGLAECRADGLGGEVLKGVCLDGVDNELVVGVDGSKATRDEPLLGAGRLDNLEHTGAELLNGGNVRSEDTHVSCGRGNVDLGDLGRVVDGLRALITGDGDGGIEEKRVSVLFPAPLLRGS